MQGEQSVNSDEASEFRRILEASPHTYTTYSPPTDESDSSSHVHTPHRSGDTTNPAGPVSPGQESRATQTRDFPISSDTRKVVMSKDRHGRKRHRSRSHGHKETDSLKSSYKLDKLSPTQLQVLLTRADERLTSESKRAAAAELRAQNAEARAIALVKEILTIKQDVSTEKAKRAAYEVQVGQARAEILRAQEQIDAMARSKHQAEEEAARERGNARQVRHEMDIQRAVEAGRQEGYAHGWTDGNREGRRRAMRQAQTLGYIDSLPPDQASQYIAPTTGSTQPLDGTYPPDGPGLGSMPASDIPPTMPGGGDFGPPVPDKPVSPVQMPIPDVPIPNTNFHAPVNDHPPPPIIPMPEPDLYVHPPATPNNSLPLNAGVSSTRSVTSPVGNGRASSRMSHRSRVSVPVVEPTAPSPRPPSRQPSPVPAQRISLLEPDPIPRPKSPRPDTGLNRSASRPTSRMSRHSIIENDIPIADDSGTFSLPPPHAMMSSSTPGILSPRLGPKQQPAATGAGSVVPPVTISVPPPVTISVQPPSNEVSASRSHLELIASPVSSVSSASDLPVPVPLPKSPRTKGPPSAKKGRRMKMGVYDPNKKRQGGDSGSENSSWDFMIDFAGSRGPSDTEDIANARRANSPLSVIPERPLSEASRPPSHSPALAHNMSHRPSPAQFDQGAVTQQLDVPPSRPLSRAASQQLRDNGSRSPFGSAPQLYENVLRSPSRPGPQIHNDIPRSPFRAVSPTGDNQPIDPGFVFNPNVQENGASQYGSGRLHDLSAIDDSRARNNASVKSGSSRHTMRSHRVTPVMPAPLGGNGLALPPVQRARPSQDVEFLEKQVRSESVTSAQDDERSVIGRHPARPTSMNNVDMPSITVQSGTPPAIPQATTPGPNRRHSIHTSPNIRSRSPFQNNHLLSPSTGARPFINDPPPVIEPAPTPPDEHPEFFMHATVQQNEGNQASGFPAGFVPAGPPKAPGALERTPARGGLPAITPARVPLPVSTMTTARNLPAESSQRYPYAAAPPGAMPGDVLPRQTPYEGRRKSLVADDPGQSHVMGKTPFSRPRQLGDSFAGNYSSGRTPVGSTRILGMTPAAGRSNLPASGNAAEYSVGAPLEAGPVEEPVLPSSWRAPPTGRAAYSTLSKKTPGMVSRNMTGPTGYAPAPGSTYGQTPAYHPVAFQGDPGSVQLAAGIALPGSSRAPTLMLGKTPARPQRRLSEGFAGAYDPGAPLPREEGTPARSVRQLPPNNAASYDVGAPVPMGTPVMRTRRSSQSGLYTGSPIIPDTSLRNTPRVSHITPASAADRRLSLYDRMVEEIPEQGF